MKIFVHLFLSFCHFLYGKIKYSPFLVSICLHELENDVFAKTTIELLEMKTHQMWHKIRTQFENTKKKKEKKNGKS